MNYQAMQGHRAISVSTPLADDVLLFKHMTGSEELGRLFEYRLTLLSEDDEIRLEDVLGQAMTVALESANDETRYYHGFVSRFGQVDSSAGYATYEAVLKPWLWFLSRTSNCRIFQNLTVPEIVKQVFRDHGFNDFDEDLTGSYRSWEYCVQYRETAFNFISRLLEQEGIYYFFRHDETKHSLVLCDSISAHTSHSGYETIPYRPVSANATYDHEHIFNWYIAQEVQPGAYVLQDFDYSKPKSNLKVKSSNPRDHAGAEYEVYDYPGAYLVGADGENYVKARFEELQAQFERVRGSSNARGLSVGSSFSLCDYPRGDQNRDYIVTSATTELNQNDYESGSIQSGPTFHCDFEAIFAEQAYRSVRGTSKPIVQGPQTAIVVGKAGEEIWTDKHGRVKVQFHWDREGQYDENSSCWIRVSQVHAGKGFGGIDIPRIGEEVIVEFLEGDPDRPIITGRVYNGDNKPPTSLPDGGMISGLKSNSTPGGGGDNSITLDDTKGKEQITIHGQYNMSTTIDNDQANTISNNRTTDIGVNDTQTVGANQTITVNGHRSETVNAGEDVTVNGGRTHTVSGVQSTTISVAETHSVGAGRMHNVGAGEMIDVGGVQAINVGGAQNVAIGGLQAVTVGALQKFTVGGAHSLSAAAISETSKGPIKLKAASTVTIEAPTIVLKAGGSKIILNSGGITIKGAKINGKASGKISLNGSGGIKLKGPSIGEN